MNAKQSNKLASYIATEAVLQATPEIDSVPGFREELTTFSAKMGEINSLAITQTQSVEGRKARRDELLAAMAEAAVDLATVVAIYADKQKLAELAPVVRVGLSDFARVRKTHRPWLAQKIREAAQPELPQLASYGVTAATLEALGARINAALRGLHLPRTMIVVKKTATERLAGLFDEIDALLEGQIDRMVFSLRKTNPEFYAEYRSARSILDLPGRRRAPAGTPAPQAPVTAPAVSPATTQKAAA